MKYFQQINLVMSIPNMIQNSSMSVFRKIFIHITTLCSTQDNFHVAFSVFYM